MTNPWEVSQWKIRHARVYQQTDSHGINYAVEWQDNNAQCLSCRVSSSGAIEFYYMDAGVKGYGDGSVMDGTMYAHDLEAAKSLVEAMVIYTSNR